MAKMIAPRRAPFLSPRHILLSPIFLVAIVSVVCSACAVPAQRMLYPFTEGFHHKLPEQASRILVWEDHGRLSMTVMAWLQKRGLILIEPAKLRQLLDTQPVSLTHTLDDDVRLLRAGKTLNAQTLLFIDSAIGSRYEGETPSDEAAISAEFRRLYSGSVTIRGVDIETGELILMGHAEYPPSLYVGNPEEMERRLTCQALATAWGFRAPGNQPIPSDSMCTVAGQ